MESRYIQELREQNEKQIRLYLMEYGPCVLPDIAAGTGLSARLAAKTLDAMLQRGEIINADSRFSLNPDHAHVLVIALRPETLYYRVCNLNHQTREEGSRAVEGETHIAQMADIVSQIRMKHKNLRLIQLGIPGNTQNGRLVYMAEDFYLVGHDIAAELGRYCHLPIALCNDVNAMAYGFYRSHIEASIGDGSMVYLYESRFGAGAGIVANGRLVTGFSGFAGEIANLWPPQTGREAQLKSQVSAVLSLLNPGLLVVAHEPDLLIDREAITSYVQQTFPAHAVPKMHFAQRLAAGPSPALLFTCEYEENYVDGLTDLAVEAVLAGKVGGAGRLLQSIG